MGELDVPPTVWRTAAAHADQCLDSVVSAYVERPHACCLGGCCTIFVLAVLSVASGFMTMTEVEDAWQVSDATATQWLNAYTAAREQVDVEVDGGGEPMEEKSEPTELFFYYKTDVDATGMIFTPARLQEMCELERIVVNQDTFGAEVRVSPVRLFYGSGASSSPLKRTLDGYDWGCEELSQASVDGTVATILQDVQAKGPESPYAGLVHPSFPVSGQSAVTMSFIHVFATQEGWDRATVMDKVFASFDPPLEFGFLQSAYQVDEDRFAERGPLRVRIYYSGSEEDYIMQDFSMAFLAVVVVFLVMWWYLNSLFLASTGMFQILFSMPVSSILYRGLFQVGYFHFIHVLTVYLVLGIGADDLFVLLDTWRHISEGQLDPKDKAKQKEVLKKTMVRAAQAIWNTSFTTTVAFLSGSVSRLMPMRTTGWYASICILMNYLFVITFTPSLLIVYVRHFQSCRSLCSHCAALPGMFSSKLSRVIPDDTESSTASVEEKPLPLIERMLIKGYIPLMRRKPIAIGVVLIMSATAVQGIYWASRLTPPRKPEVWFPENHMWVNLDSFLVNNFYSPDYDRYVQMSFFWGIAGLDTTGFDVYNPDDFKGVATFDSAFDLSTAEAQRALLETCAKLRTETCSLEGCRNAGFGTLMLQAKDETSSCFLEDFQEWLRAERNISEIPTGSQFLEELTLFRDEASPPPDMVVDVDYRRDIGIIGGQLRYVVVSIRSTLPRREPVATGKPVRDLVEDFAEARRRASPDSMKSLKFTASGRFAGYDLGQELLNGLFSGCAIALPISFLVLLASTKNVIISLFAVVSVASIVLCVLGFCKSSQDWDLGIGEAIAGVIVIGYSVDYVIHLAHMYCEAREHGHHKRGDRAEFAIRNMGSTVFAGAITTACSGSVMFACFITFFFKMALLITVTIMYSFLFSLGFFVGLLWLVGPEGSCGDLPLCRHKEHAQNSHEGAPGTGELYSAKPAP